MLNFCLLYQSRPIGPIGNTLRAITAICDTGSLGGERFATAGESIIILEA